MITETFTLQEQHPALLPFEHSSDADPLTDVLRFLDRAVSSRPTTFAMHFELHAPRGCAPFDFRRAFDRFLTKYLTDLKRDGHAAFCAWGLAGTIHVRVIRVLLLLGGREPNSIGMHLRSAENAWRDAHGIADANGLVGYYEHPDSYGGRIGNGITIENNTDGIDANWADCFRWAQMLVDEGGATGLRAVGFHVPGRDRSATPSLRD
jgi:hypothetical protein